MLNDEFSHSSAQVAFQSPLCSYIDMVVPDAFSVCSLRTFFPLLLLLLFFFVPPSLPGFLWVSIASMFVNQPASWLSLLSITGHLGQKFYMFVDVLHCSVSTAGTHDVTALHAVIQKTATIFFTTFVVVLLQFVNLVSGCLVWNLVLL